MTPEEKIEIEESFLDEPIENWDCDFTLSEKPYEYNDDNEDNIDNVDHVDQITAIFTKENIACDDGKINITIGTKNADGRVLEFNINISYEHPLYDTIYIDPLIFW